MYHAVGCETDSSFESCKLEMPFLVVSSRKAAKIHLHRSTLEDSRGVPERAVKYWRQPLYQ